MYQLKEYRRIDPLRKPWRDMVTTSVYQTWFVQKKLFETRLVYSIINRYTPRYYVVCKDGKPQLIFPLCRHQNKTSYSIWGGMNGFQLYDILCLPELQPEEISAMVLFVLKKIRAASLQIQCLPESAMLYQAVLDLAEQKKIHLLSQPMENVMICADEGYENYYAQLSKHTRQNLRTAYNRMNKDGISCSLEIVAGKPVPQKLFRDIMTVYYNRHASRYGVKTSAIKKYYLQRIDFSTRCLQQYPDNFAAVLYMDDCVAGFMAGMQDADGSRIIIPRLSINEMFLKYSPGMVLINEAMQYLTEKTSISRLDLSKGAEQYKFAMGGNCYYTYSMQIEMLEGDI